MFKYLGLRTLAPIVVAVCLAANSALAASLPLNYENQEACAKRDHLWIRKILPSRWSALPAISGQPVLEKLITSISSLFSEAFDDYSDERAYRAKLFHELGVVAKVRFRPAASSIYTGLLSPANGDACGLARLSLGGPPEKGYLPGLALKLFISGRPSADVHAIYRLDPEIDSETTFETKFLATRAQDFFAQPLSNVIPEPRQQAFKLFVRFARRWARDPLHLAVFHLTQFRTDGAVEPDPRWPEQLIFESASVRFAPETKEDFRVDLATVVSGSVLYRVFARDLAGRGERHLIGEVVTESPFVASEYADRQLHFRHQR